MLVQPEDGIGIEGVEFKFGLQILFLGLQRDIPPVTIFGTFPIVVVCVDEVTTGVSPLPVDKAVVRIDRIGVFLKLVEFDVGLYDVTCSVAYYIVFLADLSAEGKAGKVLDSACIHDSESND